MFVRASRLMATQPRAAMPPGKSRLPRTQHTAAGPRHRTRNLGLTRPEKAAIVGV